MSFYQDQLQQAALPPSPPRATASPAPTFYHSTVRVLAGTAFLKAMTSPLLQLNKGTLTLKNKIKHEPLFRFLLQIMMETKSRAGGEGSAGGALTVQAAGSLLQSPECDGNPSTGERTGGSLGLTVGQLG